MKNNISNFQNNLTCPIAGEDLFFLFNNTNYPACLFDSKVSQSAPVALQKIKNHYLAIPNIDGNNNQGITQIRDTLFATCNNKSVINSLTIIAPHTHWEDKSKPTIYSYNEIDNLYIIGCHTIKEDECYIPVSFVFSDGIPLPFEWAELVTTKINIEEWETSYKVIQSLNTIIAQKNLPFGIAIDFRFKNDLADFSVHSVELPIEDENNKFFGFSYISTREYFVKNNYHDATEQVSWHPRSELVHNFTIDESNALKQLRDTLSQFDNDKDRELFLEEVKFYLNN